MMKNHRSLLTLTAAGLLAVSASLRAEDATPPGAPPPPPPGAPGEGPGPGGPRGPGGPGGPRMDPAARIKELKEKLNLTDDQVEKIKAVFEKNRPQMEALRADQSLSPEDRRTKAMGIRKAQQEEIKALLTPEQKEKFKDAWKEGRGPGGPGAGPGGPGGPGGKRGLKGAK